MLKKIQAFIFYIALLYAKCITQKTKIKKTKPN